MKRKTLKRSLLALSLALPLAAFARDAIVVDNIDLQSGPDEDYPAITQLSAGTEVQVQGCIDNYDWCDVLASGDRGWVPGTFLAEEYDGNRVLIVDAGPRIGIPVVSFEIGAYWGEHYHNRPFYAQRETFVSRHITPHAPRRPSEVALNRVNVNVQAGVNVGHEHEAGAAARTDVRGQANAHAQTGTNRNPADVRAREQQTRNAAASANASANANGSTTPPQQQHAMTTHKAPPATQTSPPAQQPARATAETRDNERNVPNTRNDQREGAHGMQHPMPPTVQGGDGQHQVAANKSASQPHEQAKQPPKSDKDKSKNKDESSKDHDHEQQ